MKTIQVLIYIVVLWTKSECRHVARHKRSLELEGKGSNLTQKQQQEVIHADILQHFITTQTTPVKSVNINLDSVSDSTPSFAKDKPFIAEEINVQNLKNDEQLSAIYGKKITFEKENAEDYSSEKNKTVRSNINDISSYQFNHTGPSGSGRPEASMIYSSNDHLLSSVNDENYAKESHEKQMHENRPPFRSIEEANIESDQKTLEVKKKEKGKKEILDSVTAFTDYDVAGKIEKPYKDSITSIKLKDRNKDFNSEALDERRSTTRVNSSSSVRLGEHDNNKSLDSLEIFKDSSFGTSNEESVNQSVNSVINANGVNSDSLKNPQSKYSVKRARYSPNDTEVDKSYASENLLNEEPVKATVPTLILNTQPTHPSVTVSTTGSEKIVNQKQNQLFLRQKTTESTPIKIDIFGKIATPSLASFAKPSLAIKHQIANKLKGLEPSPTNPMKLGDDEMDDNQDKSGGKTSTKSTLRKKLKTDYYSSSSESYIPPTVRAWTLVSSKPAAKDLMSHIPESSSTDENVKTILDIVPKSIIVPTNMSLRISPADSLNNISSTEKTTPLYSEDLRSVVLERKNTKDTPEIIINAPTTEEQSIIRSTIELDRNLTETSINLLQSSLNDIMVKDQSSTISHDRTQIFGVPISTTTQRAETLNEKSIIENVSEDVLGSGVAEKENIIETKPNSFESEIHAKAEETQNKADESLFPGSINRTSNEVSPLESDEKLKDIKPLDINQSFYFVITSSTSAPESLDFIKTKNMSEVAELDSAAGDILIDGPGDEGKSGEESEEDEKPKQTTTLLPLFEPFETTVISDLDEDVDVEGDREDDDLGIILDKLTTSQKTTENSTKSHENEVTLSLSTLPEINSTSSYVTSFDIVSKENTTQVVTKDPSGGNINWYEVDTKPVNVSVELTSHNITFQLSTVPADTTLIVHEETTIEPETSTETSKQETTIVPETTEAGTSVFMTTTAAMTEPSVSLEDGSTVAVNYPTSCVRIDMHVSPMKLCHEQQQLRENIASHLITEEVTWEQVLIVGRRLEDCDRKEQSSIDQLVNVDICFVNKNQEPSLSIKEEFLKQNSKQANDPSYPIVDVRTIMPTSAIASGFDNVLAAIVLSVIAAICLVLLGILLVIIRKRQNRFNYGQRCTPVSLDDYSLDNISVYNSVRRKGGVRASKRSYGNPAFDDPGGPTRSINFAGLANFSSDREALDEEFNQIPMITVKPDELPPGAESKNRYANVIPLPETRVSLQVEGKTDPLNEYMNANYIKGPKGQEKHYIACQAPLQSTVEDFWKMVWQQQTKVILMLTALNENGVEKCADYLPQLEITDCHRLFGDFQVTLKKHEVREKYIISNLQLKNLETNLWREVTHLWYSSWPSQGVPEDGSAMIAFLIEARSYTRGAQGPTVVHCSPGTGRTGTVIAIDLCIRDFETLRSVNIPKTVYALRRDRAGAVQTKDQYAFIYQVLNLYATKLTGGALDSI